MTWVAMKMLWGDGRRYLALVLGVAFATTLMAHQMSVFWGVMRRTTSLIRDLHPDGLWIMDSQALYVDESRPLSEGDLLRVRGVPEIDWAVPLAKGYAQARTTSGLSRNALLVGLDGATLIGAPRLLLGNLSELRGPDAVLVDEAGYSYLWPGEPLRLGQVLEINDRRAVVTGVCKVTLPFQTMPVLFTPYSRAIRYLPPDRRHLAYVLAEPKPGISRGAACEAVRQATGLEALSGPEYCAKTIVYYFRNTGIPLNFMVVVGIGFFVGVAIVAQTFYLFTLDNLRQFGALKAMGLSNGRLVAMALVQGAWVGTMGYSLGVGAAVILIEGLTFGSKHLEGFTLPWEVMVAVALAVAFIMAASCLLSIRPVLRLEPVMVFRT
jgi:putative ABC transport system permease protein